MGAHVQYYIVAAVQISVPQTETGNRFHKLTVKQTCERRVCAVCVKGMTSLAYSNTFAALKQL